MHFSSGVLRRSIQITMDVSADGERFDRFFPEIPYTVFGAAWIDDEDTLTRWYAPSIRLEGIPFLRLTSILPHCLRHFQAYLESLDEATIRKFDSSIKIG
jgi:hypothetical protein